ncbi:MAG: hypothetical protein GYA55_07880 [SAR324 cluster bacterium]|uniref:Uncharacterized protein n=1 Tax=SAR324 cluster bacterium TaxID=2024889 RepID=A0A7X9IKD5_9DELT|nr:hypothetical protein [SAR324 cluster bacterium]
MERQRFTFILLSIILILCAIASAFALHFANKRLSGILFFSLLFTLGFFSLDTGLCIRAKKNIALLSRFLWYCGLSFLSFRIFQENLIWQRLFFGLALSIQAFSWELAKELDSRFANSPSAIYDPLSLKFIIIPLKISLLIGPALIGLLSLGSIIPFKYSMGYLILLFSARVIALITHSITSKVIPCFARQVLALYLLFLVTLVGIRLI